MAGWFVALGGDAKSGTGESAETQEATTPAILSPALEGYAEAIP